MRSERSKWHWIFLEVQQRNTSQTTSGHKLRRELLEEGAIWRWHSWAVKVRGTVQLVGHTHEHADLAAFLEMCRLRERWFKKRAADVQRHALKIVAVIQ